MYLNSAALDALMFCPPWQAGRLTLLAELSVRLLMLCRQCSLGYILALRTASARLGLLGMLE